MSLSTSGLRIIGDTWYHENGRHAKIGSTFYHTNGRHCKIGDTFYYEDGRHAIIGDTVYHSNGRHAKIGSTWYHTNGRHCKIGSTYYDSDGKMTGTQTSAIIFRIDLGQHFCVFLTGNNIEVNAYGMPIWSKVCK
jgi:hypothetical protein